MLQRGVGVATLVTADGGEAWFPYTFYPSTAARYFLLDAYTLE